MCPSECAVETNRYAARRKEIHQYISGGGAAVCNILCTFPMFKVITRQQVDGVSAVHAAGQIKSEGFLKLYRGVAPPLLMKSAGLSVMFGSYATVQRVLTEDYPGLTQNKKNFMSGFIAGAIESVLTPFERLQTLLLLSEHRDFVKVHNTVHAFLKIYKKHSPKEFYRGFSAVLLRNSLSTSLFFGLREPLKEALPRVNGKYRMDIIEDFLLGAVLGASISTLTYPLNVVKSNMQKQLGSGYSSVPRTLMDVYQQRGRSWRKMYLGVSVNFTRALFSWGIINASFELISKFLDQNF